MAKQFKEKGSVLGCIEDAKSRMEELRDELQEWRDGLPENLQNGSKAEALDEAIGYLDDGASTLESFEPDTIPEALQNLEVEYSYSFKNPRSPSRRDRCSVAFNMLDAAVGAIEAHIDNMADDDETKDECPKADLQETCESLCEARDGLDNVEFPGAFG